MSTVAIDSEELQALRVLAKRALELSGPRPHAMFRPSDPLQWQETALIRRLIEARGQTVPANRLVEHTRTTEKHSVTDWAEAPASQVSRARAKCRHIFGVECVETVWPTRVSRRGHVVRDVHAGILGYRWSGPDIAGMALAAVEGLGLATPAGGN